jgi:hypothetical protein
MKNIFMVIIIMIVGSTFAAAKNKVTHDAPGFSIKSFDSSFSFYPDSQYIEKNGSILYFNHTLSNWSEIIVYDLDKKKMVKRISLEKNKAYLCAFKYLPAVKKIVGADMDNRIFLIDPASGAIEDLGKLCQKDGSPENISIRDKVMTISSHEGYVSVYKIENGIITFIKNIMVGSNRTLLIDERFFITDMHNIALVDMREEKMTKLINLPEWTSGATPAENIIYDRVNKVIYFTHNGSVYCYNSNAKKKPRNSREIEKTNQQMKVNGGHLYILDKDFYAYDKYSLGLSVKNGELCIVSSDYYSNYTLSLTEPFGKKKTILTDNDGDIITRYSLFRAESAEIDQQIDQVFIDEIMKNGIILEEAYTANFSGISLNEFTKLIAEDKVLNQICGDEFYYKSFPGVLRFNLFASNLSSIGGKESVVDDVGSFLTDHNVSYCVFQQNPFAYNGILFISILKADDIETLRTDITARYGTMNVHEIDSKNMSGKTDEIIIIFAIRGDASTFPEVEKKLTKHFKERYRGFGGLKKGLD